MAGIIPVTQMYGQAQAAWDAQQAEFRRRAAYNALNRMYGPVAGDPDAALKMQSYDFNRQMQPLQLQNQQLTNQAVESRENYLTQSRPLLLENQRLSNAGQGITNNFNSEKLDQAKLTTDGQRALQVHGVLGGALDSLGADLNGVDDPNQRGALFDQAIARVAPLVGADPQAIGQQLAADRQVIMRDGADGVQRLRSDLDSTIYAGLSPKDRATILKTQAQTELANAKLNTEQNKLLTQKYGKPGELQKSISAGQFLNGRVGNVIGTVRTTQSGATQYGVDGLLGQAFQLMSKLPQDGASLKAESLVPGSDAYKLKGVLDQISHNLSVDDLRNMKQSGLSLGRVTVAEFQAVSKAIANTDVAQGADMLRTQLGRVGKLYGDLYKANNDDIATMQQHLQELQGGTAQPAPPARKVPGVPQATIDKDTGSVGVSDPATGRVAFTSPNRLQGTLQIGGLLFDFASGGAHRGNVPFGTYSIGEFTTGDQRRRTGHSYTRDAFPVGGQIPDKRYPGAPRAGILIHEGSSGTINKVITSGCLGIPRTEWGAARDALIAMQKAKGPLVIDVTPNGAVVRPAKGYPKRQLTGVKDFTQKATELRTAGAQAEQAQQPQGNGLMANAPAPQTQAPGAGPMPQSTAGQQQQQQAPAPAPAPAGGGDDLMADAGGQEGAPEVPIDQKVFGPVRTLGDATTILKQMGVIP